MKILVTGGCGFIGSNIANAFSKEGHRIILYDNLSRPNVYRNLFWLMFGGKRKISFFQKSVTDFEELKRAMQGVDVVFHFAGQVGVQTSIDNPRFDFEENALGTLNVLEAARLSGRNPLIVFASTNKVYGDVKKKTPVDESQPLDFRTPYGCSKGTGDQYMLDYYRIYNLPTVVLRMSCIYGKRQFGTEEQGWVAHFMFSCAKKKPITIYGDGTQVRDILYIDDYVELCKMLVENKDKVAGQVFNIGGGEKNAISIGEALEKIQKMVEKTKISYADWRPADQHTYISNISKIKKFVGWEPKIEINEGLRRLKKWVESQKSQS